MKDFGTSLSPKSTRLRDSLYCPGRPASVPLRHTIASSALATQHSLKWLDGVSDVLADFLRGYGKHTPSPLRKSARTYAYRGLRLFSAAFEWTLYHSADLLGETDRYSRRGLSRMLEQVYLIRRR